VNETSNHSQMNNLGRDGMESPEGRGVTTRGRKVFMNMVE